ncbi:copper homeostasis protein CutC [Oscillochloris sp. ZM17-4]|uniref:copper homeostasis protein CutC n=1 Tax=Oscillochloris sp. ZM17-4 TaxID=2866714 RepID=UPI001C73B639|nr:copper homeostasis protein CutC [Oscillochloris sp. ZM17-4]MBX0328264.1 copper homeostasis protein CutC [Oscillochloris sp. ZM17-4]
MSKDVLIEVCIDSVESAIASEQGGADRVELCDNLMEGGTTPSAGAIAEARARIGIALSVMIRPRGGDFCYSEVDLAIMRRDIEVAKQLGADCLVFGMLTPDGDIDVPLTRELIALARPLPVTFHRAFDVARDPYQALEDLIAVGADRVLTTGQEASVIEGLDLVAELVRRAAGRIIVMPGGASERQIGRVRAATGAMEFHVLSTRTVESAMRFRNERVFMGGTLRPPEYERQVIDPAAIRRIRAGAG